MGQPDSIDAIIRIKWLLDNDRKVWRLVGLAEIPHRRRRKQRVYARCFHINLAIYLLALVASSICHARHYTTLDNTADGPARDCFGKVLKLEAKSPDPMLPVRHQGTRRAK